MLTDFPFDQDHYAMTMGTRALDPADLIVVDPARYTDELALKDAILASDERYYLQVAPGAASMVWEALTYLLPIVARRYPDHFDLVVDGDTWCWTNRLLDRQTRFIPGDPATLPRSPLDWLGRQMQEDLLILDGAVAGTPLVAGHLCFAAGWCLDDKLGQSFLAIHEPVPGFEERIGRSSDLLMQRIKPDHPSYRVGWSLTPSADLNRAPRVSGDRASLGATINPDNAGERLFLRLERQTFSRLSESHAVLFTIHTTLTPLSRVLIDHGRLARFTGVIRTLPPALCAYKGIAAYHDSLLAYLERRLGE